MSRSRASATVPPEDARGAVEAASAEDNGKTIDPTRVGHATVSITLDTYSHAIPAAHEEAAALIAGLVFASG